MNGEYGMTVDEAIRFLQQAREQLGGDAPLVMPDDLGVRLEIRDGLGGGCVCATDQAKDSLDDLKPARASR
jgi:hypothetical protein